MRRKRRNYSPAFKAKVAFAKLYMTKTSITAAGLLNDRVLPFFARHEPPLLRILTGRGTEEYCGKAEQHDYQLYLALNDIDHTKTKARSPQGRCCIDRLNTQARAACQLYQQCTTRINLTTLDCTNHWDRLLCCLA